MKYTIFFNKIAKDVFRIFLGKDENLTPGSSEYVGLISIDPDKEYFIDSKGLYWDELPSNSELKEMALKHMKIDITVKPLPR